MAARRLSPPPPPPMIVGSVYDSDCTADIRDAAQVLPDSKKYLDEQRDKFVDFWEKYMRKEVWQCFDKFIARDINTVDILECVDDEILQMIGIKQRMFRKVIMQGINKYLKDKDAQ